MFKGTNNSFIGSLLNMSADIFVQQNLQDKNTGAMTKEWVYFKTIQCKIEPVKSKGASSAADSKVFAKGSDMSFTENLQLKMHALQLMSKRWRIENIRTSDNNKIYIEIDMTNNPDTKFEVIGSHAVMDPFGKVTFYETVLIRSTLQDDSKS